MDFKLIGPVACPPSAEMGVCPQVFSVSEIGYGDISLSGAELLASPESFIHAVGSAFAHNLNVFHTADYLVQGAHESLMGEAVAGFREKIILASSHKVSGRPNEIEAAFHASCSRLKTDYLDIYYLDGLDEANLREAVLAAKRLLDSGKIKGIGLAGASAELIEKAFQICPITAVQIDYSLWDRTVESDGVLQVCKRLGIACFSKSPFGKARANLAKEAFSDSEQAALEALQAIASAKGVSSEELVLCWLIHQGCIPLSQLNAIKKEITLSPEDLAAINALFPRAMAASSSDAMAVRPALALPGGGLRGLSPGF